MRRWLGMLCFIEGDWPLIGGSFTIDGLHVLRPEAAAKQLTPPGSPGEAQRHALHRRLAAAFPPGRPASDTRDRTARVQDQHRGHSLVWPLKRWLLGSRWSVAYVSHRRTGIHAAYPSACRDRQRTVRSPPG
jgi:hypothetical protein